VALLLAVVGIWPERLRADGEKPPLPRTLEAIRQEIEETRRTLEETRLLARGTEASLEEARRAEARSTLDVRLRVERLGARTRALTEELSGRRAEGATLAEARERGRRAVLEIAEGLLLRLLDLPFHDEREAELRGAAAALLPGGGIEEGIDGGSTVVRVLEEVLAEASRVTLRRAGARVASGRTEEVEVLSLGGVSYFARGEGGSIEMAVRRDSSAGFGFSAALSTAEKKTVQAAMETLALGGPAVVRLPLDITGQVRSTPQGLLARLAALFEAGGLLMTPLLVVAVLALVLLGERAWVLHREGTSFAKGSATVLELCREHRHEEAEVICAATRGVVPRTLHACLARREGGQQAMEDAIQERLLHELPRMRRFLGGVAVLGSVAPLLGLLGTVTGMIRTFSVIQEHGNTTPGLLAGGIGEALLTTASGLAVAIPVLLLHSLLQGRVDRILADAEKSAASLLNTLAAEE
jgi:biopolymer transport protein ExbB